MREYYIYVCYPIISRNDKKMVYLVNFEEMESFSTMSKAVAFCQEHYAKYVVAVEKCSKDLYDDIRSWEEGKK